MNSSYRNKIIRGFQAVVGIDEAGRGPLAGPVAVGVVKIPSSSRISFQGLKDSKQLSEKERELWFHRLMKWQKEGKLTFAVSLVSSRIVDREGITAAINLALVRSLAKVEADPKKEKIYLDGGLKAPTAFTQETVIKGDEKLVPIALASIAAKVTRDRMMKRVSSRYPSYGFEIHKGYGTKQHRQAILAHGPCLLHRASFLHALTALKAKE